MRAVIQKVKSAGVVVAGEQVASIGKGLLVLVGIDRSESTRSQLLIFGPIDPLQRDKR